MRTEDSSWKESNPLNVTNLNRGVMIDQFGCVVIEVPYNSRQPIEKQFASIFFEPKVKNPEIQAPKIRKDSLTVRKLIPIFNLNFKIYIDVFIGRGETDKRVGKLTS